MDCCRHSFKENSDDISRINLDSNPLFHQINSSVVVAVINFIYTGTHWFYNYFINHSSTSNIFTDYFPLSDKLKSLSDRLHEQQHR